MCEIINRINSITDLIGVTRKILRIAFTTEICNPATCNLSINVLVLN